MILEKDVKSVIKTIEGYYKNMQLANYVLNKEEKCIDIALYDDMRRSEVFGRYFGSHNFRSTEIACQDMTDRQLERVKRVLEKMGIKENTLYEPPINETIYNIGDVVLYENDSYGKIIDIDRNNMGKEETYPYGIVFQDIYLENRPFWAEKTEIRSALDKEKIKEIDEWYSENKADIDRGIRELQEEMESDY